MDTDAIVVVVIVVLFQLIPFGHACYQIVERRTLNSNGDIAVAFRKSDRDRIIAIEAMLRELQRVKSEVDLQARYSH